ncbi:TIGR01777 family protein [Pedobacter steynii]|nr:TIGR01777 family oxidoreductase [Pedobacter steynii]NQX40460.1 TIGR01777 family protein [Pedobacter steynii]
MNKHILMTGATGMIGRKLIGALQEKGHTVAVLSRKPVAIENVKVFLWNVYEQEIDPACLEGVNTIIHLAGENVAGKKWSPARKKKLIDSRVLSAKLLYQLIKEQQTDIQAFISASAVGYYGDRGDQILTEESSAGTGFLAECCRQWEAAVDEGAALGLRIVKCRIGFVLARNEGALPALDKPIRFFVGAGLGSGKQWVPWIHVDDVVEAFLSAVENDQWTGPYNICAPFPVSNLNLSKAIAKKLHRPVWPINVPEGVLKLILGEMSSVALISNNTSAQKILDTGFKFKFLQLENALTDIYQV